MEARVKKQITTFSGQAKFGNYFSAGQAVTKFFFCP